MYMYKYEYRFNGRLCRVECCSGYKTYEEADAELSEDLSRLESRGATEVQGEVYEVIWYKSKH